VKGLDAFYVLKKGKLKTYVGCAFKIGVEEMSAKTLIVEMF